MLKLKLENINKTFDGKNFVVKNFNLEVNNEDFVVLVGPPFPLPRSGGGACAA